VRRPVPLATLGTRLLAALALTSGRVDGSSGADRAVRAGGVNSAPSMRPWRYHGANPDGWGCPKGACSTVPNRTAVVDREMHLARAHVVSTLRIEFPWTLIEPKRGRFDWRRADYIVRAATRLVRAVLAAHGQPKKPIWLGEYVFPEADPSAPQQTALIREVLTGAAPLAAAQWYSLRDTLTVLCCPPQTIDPPPGDC
jgi:hypothetical protein